MKNLNFTHAAFAMMALALMGATFTYSANEPAEAGQSVASASSSSAWRIRAATPADDATIVASNKQTLSGKASGRARSFTEQRVEYAPNSGASTNGRYRSLGVKDANL